MRFRVHGPIEYSKDSIEFHGRLVGLEWVTQNLDGAILTFDSASFGEIPELLDAYNDLDVPMVLVSLDAEDKTMAQSLVNIFNADYVVWADNWLEIMTMLLTRISYNGPLTYLEREPKAEEKPEEYRLSGSYRGSYYERVEGMSVVQMIEKMTSDSLLELEFTQTMLILYPKFLKPSEFLDRLLDRFDETWDPNHPQHATASQLRVCNVLLMWLTKFRGDFHTEKMHFTLIVFLEVVSNMSSLTLFAKTLSDLVFPEHEMPKIHLPDWCLFDENDCELDFPSLDPDHFKRLSMMECQVPPPTDEASIDTFINYFLDLEPEILGQQITVMEWSYFCKIQPRDLVSHVWSKSQKGKHGISVAPSIKFFNFMASWAMSMVLLSTNTKIRSRVFLKLIQVCQFLLKVNNYNSLMALVSGLNNSCLSRLHHTHRYLLSSPTFTDDFPKISRLLASERSFVHYRQALKTASLPSIPYIGVFHRDLVYLDEAFKDTKSDGSIHIQKFLLMGDLLLSLVNFQFKGYPFLQNDSIESFIRLLVVSDEESCYQRSLELEPRE